MKNLKRIPIVYYHSIAPIDKNWNRNFLSLPPEVFEKQIKAFKKRFDIIDLSEYWNIRNHIEKGPANPLVVTIDDGFLDNWVWAFPVLKKYEVKATVFVSPEMVDPRDILRPHTDGLKASENKTPELSYQGYLSWPEIRAMSNRGLIDIQSHTMSHTKYFVSDKIIGFHHPNSDCLYPIGNIDTRLKPHHIGNKAFEQVLPYGTPFFEEKSAVVARKVEINKDFNQTCVELLQGYDFGDYHFNEVFNIIKPVYEKYLKNENLIVSTESEQAYLKRLNYEIEKSKTIIENETNKKVEFLCWPHGDNNTVAHDMAISAGYKATTIGNADVVDAPDRIALRIGVETYKGSTSLGIFKALAKIEDYKGNTAYKFLKKIYQLTR